MDAAQRNDGAGVQFTTRLESCNTSLLNKNKQVLYPKKMEHVVAQSSDLITDDVVGPNGTKSFKNSRYSQKSSDQHTGHSPVYFIENNTKTVRNLKNYQSSLAITKIPEESNASRRISEGSMYPRNAGLVRLLHIKPMRRKGIAERSCL